jgi:hypothetical protein
MRRIWGSYKPLHILLGTRQKWMVSFFLWLLYQEGTALGTHRIDLIDGWAGRSGHGGDRRNVCILRES